MLANVVPLPLIIYNIPPLRIFLYAQQLMHWSSSQYCGDKRPERSEERLAKSLALWKDRTDFGHFLGWAAKSAEALIGGSDGLIPSTGNLVQWIYTDMLKAVNTGDVAKAYKMQLLSDAYGNVYQAGKTLGESLWALKALMQYKGICSETVMPPLQGISEEEKQNLSSLKP
jgi:4-hydroxy-tetrahydrodipicolinate synthase